MTTPSVHLRPRWAWPTVAFAVGYGLLRVYWLAGGRWAYTACDWGGDPPGASGCGADRVTTLSFLRGWGAVAGCALLVGIAVLALRRSTAAAAVAGVAAWIACAALVLLAFPMHLLFQVPAGLAGRDTDWRGLADRIVLLLGGVLFGLVAYALRPPAAAPTGEPRPVPRWVRSWARAGVAVPVVGWSLPHALWLLGVRFGIASTELTDIKENLSAPLGFAITVVPALASLLTLGLAQRWGQVFPHWLPLVGDRPVPRLLALIPAGVVALSLIAYGLISCAIMISALATGDLTWSEFGTGWAVDATVLVFLGWGIALGVTAFGYYRVTGQRPRAA